MFPTAAKRRAQAFNRSLVNQWFDIWDLKNEGTREDLQFEGLKESAEHVHAFLRTALAEVENANVVLWGLSQGCATGLISLMLLNGKPPAAFVGMCGWLPLRKRMTESWPGDTIVEDDPFQRLDHEPPLQSKAADAASCLRELLGLSPNEGQIALMDTPVFWGHGTQDEKVDIQLGRKASSFLEDLGHAVEFREYQGLGHWCSDEMLRDIVDFLGTKTAFGVDDGCVSLARQKADP